MLAQWYVENHLFMNKSKVIAVAIVAVCVIYDVSPFDIIPDAVVGVGWVDDIIVSVLAGLNLYKKFKTGKDDQNEEKLN